MRAIALLGAVAVLSPVGCSSGTASMLGTTTVLTSARVSPGDLDDDQIASIARRVQVDQRVLSELAQRQGGDLAVRQLGASFVRDNSATEVPQPTIAPRPSAIEDGITQRDVTTELRLARYGGRSFDRPFLEVELEILRADIELVDRVLAPRATDPVLRARLERLTSLLSDELRELRALATPGASH